MEDEHTKPENDSVNTNNDQSKMMGEKLANTTKYHQHTNRDVDEATKETSSVTGIPQFF